MVGGGWVNFSSGAHTHTHSHTHARTHAHTHTHTHALLSGGVMPSLSVMVCAFLSESNHQHSEKRSLLQPTNSAFILTLYPHYEVVVFCVCFFFLGGGGGGGAGL